MRILKLTAVVTMALALGPGAIAQRCQNWIEVVAGSFLPKTVDQGFLREFSSLSPEQYFQMAQEAEEKNLSQLAQSQYRVTSPATAFSVEPQLRYAMARFYDVGFKLYGVRLDPQNVIVSPGLELNAFASGSRVFMNEGLIQYFLQPQAYVLSQVVQPGHSYTPEQYQWSQANFGWQQDWNSIYFVLAHEAAHNLMRHRDEKVLVHVRGLFGNYRQGVLNHRKDVAHGRTGGGAKRYLWQSLQNLAAAFQNADKNRATESEADLIALMLLRRSGFDPNIALTATERMMAFFGARPMMRGWQGAMTEVFCSTHPDLMARHQRIQQNINCLRFTGKLCQEHVTYPVETLLAELQKGMEELDEYNEQTQEIAEQGPDSSGPDFEVKIEVEPKDSQLLVNGNPVPPGKFRLPVGAHKLAVSRAGYEPSETQIVVFPDVHPKLKVKLKRSKR